MSKSMQIVMYVFTEAIRRIVFNFGNNIRSLI